MATTRKSQPDRKSRRQKQPATIDLEANPTEVPETEAEAAGAFVFADQTASISGDGLENEASGESASEETAVDTATMQASEAGEPARADKRGVVGTYHHVSEAHLKRYLAEFDFRYNERAALGISDIQRTNEALKGISGKRLTYRRTNEAAHA